MDKRIILIWRNKRGYKITIYRQRRKNSPTIKEQYNNKLFGKIYCRNKTGRLYIFKRFHYNY